MVVVVVVVVLVGGRCGNREGGEGGILCVSARVGVCADTYVAVVQKEFETILQNRAVVPKLNELESLFSDAARRRDEGGEPPVP